MNVWANAILTNKGRALLAKLTQGNTLDIVDAIVGAGFVTPGVLVEQTGVTKPMQQLKARPVSYPEIGSCDLTLMMTNEGVTTGYEATQVGIYANDPDEGKILFLLAQSVTADNGTTVPSETEMPGYSAEWTFRLKYGQADGIHVTVDPANTVTWKEMELYIQSAILPITNEQIDELIYGSVFDPDSAPITFDQIDYLVGSDVLVLNPGTGGSGTGSGAGTMDHSLLYNRNISDQHTIESITGLEDALTAAQGTTLDSESIETAWDNAFKE